MTKCKHQSGIKIVTYMHIEVVIQFSNSQIDNCIAEMYLRNVLTAAPASWGVFWSSLSSPVHLPHPLLHMKEENIVYIKKKKKHYMIYMKLHVDRPTYVSMCVCKCVYRRIEHVPFMTLIVLCGRVRGLHTFGLRTGEVDNFRIGEGAIKGFKNLPIFTWSTCK